MIAVLETHPQKETHAHIYRLQPSQPYLQTNSHNTGKGLSCNDIFKQLYDVATQKSV
jgi:hypothetical protein